MLWRSPGFTAVAVFTLALGIAATTTVFSWIDNLLLRPFPGARQGEQLAVLETADPDAPNGAHGFSYLEYRDYRAGLKSFSGIAAHRQDVFSMGDAASGIQPVWGELVSGNYFRVLGVRPALGRFFTAEEDGDKLGAYPVAVISYALWRQRFHGDARAIGKTLRVNQRELTLVGVAPPEFRGTMPGLAFGIWVPVTMGRELGILSDRDFLKRQARSLYATARLAPGADLAKARAETAVFARRLETAFPASNRGVTAMALPAWEFHGGATELLSQPLRILMAIAILVLLIVCANVGNLLLARSVGRRRELSIRLALGAGRGRMSQQLLCETLLLAAAGAAAGLLLAVWTTELLPALVPKIHAPIAVGFHLSGRILAFTALACAAVTVISGAAPALLWLRSDVNEALKEGGRSGGQGARSHRLRSLLVVAEVTLATVAMVGAGLFVRSYRNAKNIDPGFDRNNVVLARFYLTGAGFSTEDMQQFCLNLRDRLRGAPGVVDVTYANYAPLGTPSGPYTSLDAEGYVPALNESRSVNNLSGGAGILRDASNSAPRWARFPGKRRRRRAPGRHSEPVLRAAIFPRGKPGRTQDQILRQVGDGDRPCEGQQVFQCGRSGAASFLRAVPAAGGQWRSALLLHSCGGLRSASGRRTPALCGGSGPARGSI